MLNIDNHVPGLHIRIRSYLINPVYRAARGGRRTLALRMVQALNCPEPISTAEPCRTCRTCSQIEKMQHTDLVVTQAEQQGGTLKVDQIRELGRGLALASYESRYKVALLLRFEEANPSASNALLKTLEEPAPHVVLIVTAESAESLLPTIVSRCEVLRLRPLPLEVVSKGLQEKWNVDPAQAALLARISGGRPGYASALHRDAVQLEKRQEWLDEHNMLLHADTVRRFVYADKCSRNRRDLPGMLIVWLSFWRDVLLTASGASVPIANLDREDEINHLARAAGFDAARTTVSAIETTIENLERNINTRLAVEVLMLDLPVVQ